MHVAASGDDSSFSVESLHTGCSARTETAPISINPDFMNKHLLLRLPCALGALLRPQAMLRCSLWAAPALDRGLAHVRYIESCPLIISKVWSLVPVLVSGGC